MELNKNNWKEIQNYYDLGNSQIQTAIFFNIPREKITEAIKFDLFKSRTISESLLIYYKNNQKIGKPHTEISKQKISQSRIKFLKQNPEKAPYKTKGFAYQESYPEKYFREIFEAENLPLKQYVSYSAYEIDFANIEKKIAIEIDGQQHKINANTIKSDQRKEKLLLNHGWRLIRIEWSAYKKLSFDDKRKIISNIIEILISENSKELTIEQINCLLKSNERIFNCIECKKIIKTKSSHCRKCSGINRRKFSISKEELEKLVWEIPTTKIAEKFNVSSKAIEKRCKNYNISKPPRGYWAKIYRQESFHPSQS